MIYPSKLSNCAYKQVIENVNLRVDVYEYTYVVPTCTYKYELILLPYCVICVLISFNSIHVRVYQFHMHVGLCIDMYVYV